MYILTTLREHNVPLLHKQEIVQGCIAKVNQTTKLCQTDLVFEHKYLITE